MGRRRTAAMAVGPGARLDAPPAPAASAAPHPAGTVMIMKGLQSLRTEKSSRSWKTILNRPARWPGLVRDLDNTPPGMEVHSV